MKYLNYNYIIVRCCIVTIILLSGCATLSEKECVRGEWQSIGYRDGVQGYPISRFDQHDQACAEYNVLPDFSRYQMGRDKGLEIYCAPNNGYKVGVEVANYGGGYQHVCPAHLEKAFLIEYARGLHAAIHQVDRDLWAKHDEIDHKRRRVSKDKDMKENERKKLQKEINSLESDLNNLVEKRRKIVDFLYQVRSKK